VSRFSVKCKMKIWVSIWWVRRIWDLTVSDDDMNGNQNTCSCEERKSEREKGER